MANLPQRIRIGTKTWKVSSPNDELHADKNFGETNPLHLDIKISTQYPKAQQRESLFHELFHAVGYSVLTNEDHLTERLLKPLCYGLLGVLRDNPDVVGFLLSEEE